MKWFRFLAAVMLVLSGAMVGCSQQSDTEQALDDVGESMGDTVEAVGDDIEDAADEAEENME